MIWFVWMEVRYWAQSVFDYSVKLHRIRDGGLYLRSTPEQSPQLDKHLQRRYEPDFRFEEIYYQDDSLGYKPIQREGQDKQNFHIVAGSSRDSSHQHRGRNLSRLTSFNL